MLTITDHKNRSYSYFSEEKKKNINIPSELGKAILEERKQLQRDLAEMQMTLKKLKALNDSDNPSKAFVEKVNHQFPGTFTNIDSGKDITDYSHSEGGEIFYNPEINGQ